VSHVFRVTTLCCAEVAVCFITSYPLTAICRSSGCKDPQFCRDRAAGGQQPEAVCHAEVHSRQQYTPRCKILQVIFAPHNFFPRVCSAQRNFARRICAVRHRRTVTVAATLVLRTRAPSEYIMPVVAPVLGLHFFGLAHWLRTVAHFRLCGWADECIIGEHPRCDGACGSFATREHGSDRTWLRRHFMERGLGHTLLMARTQSVPPASISAAPILAASARGRVLTWLGRRTHHRPGAMLGSASNVVAPRAGAKCWPFHEKPLANVTP